MARFRCRTCGGEGEFEYALSKHACPRCGSPYVQLALSMTELPDDDPLFAALRDLSDDDEKRM